MKKFLIETLLVVLIVLNLPLFRVLSVSNRKNPSEKIYSREALHGFSISYTHSVNKGRIHDYYNVERNGALKMDRSVFVSYGAGITEPEEIKDCVFTVRNDGYELSEMNIVQEQFLVAVGVIAEHSITIGESEYFLKEFFKPQTSLLLKTKRVSAINYIGSKKWKIRTTKI